LLKRISTRKGLVILSFLLSTLFFVGSCKKRVSASQIWELKCIYNSDCLFRIIGIKHQDINARIGSAFDLNKVEFYMEEKGLFLGGSLRLLITEGDSVENYTLRQIENSLIGQKTWIQWRNKIKNDHSNPTIHHVDALFNLWN